MAAPNVVIARTTDEEEAKKRQLALDTHQYSRNGILRYEFIFGKGFVSSGGGDTTKEILNEVRLPRGGKAIDVGCGIGGGTIALADKFGAHVTGVDLSENMISIAKERYNDRKNVGFLVADILRTDIAPESLDLVYSRDTILHLTVEEKKEFFKKAYEWLKPGSQIVITDYCCGPPARWDDEFREYLKDRSYRLVQVEEYAQMLSDAGFEIAKACNHTERWMQALVEESKRLEDQKDKFMHLFKPEDFKDLREGWESKRQRVAKGLQFWGFFIGVKPEGNGSEKNTAPSTAPSETNNN